MTVNTTYFGSMKPVFGVGLGVGGGGVGVGVGNGVGVGKVHGLVN
ncbi:MAG TPA: hypothetical protein VFY05_02205 [Candidatus Angelobacter sp.]|nr:hypothetical protein [Candidatus Angelobacter sp.]